LALTLALLACGVAEARVTVKATLKPAGDKSRLVVTVANTGRFTAKNKPRGVSVKYKRTTYRLGHIARTAGATGQSSGWQTPARTTYNGLVGKRVAVSVRTSTGTQTFQRTVAREKSSSPFTPPSRDLSGEEAFNQISKYFVNSRFTDCPTGGCAQEHRYDHCAGGGLDGNWEYHELPATPGSAKSGPYHVVSAYAHEDGSWGVTYRVTLSAGTAYYTWGISSDGTVQGGYAIGQDVGLLQGFHWQQPAGC
jgi:hypothetical protein